MNENSRTDIDFSKHELKVTQYEGVLIHEFKKPGTRHDMLVFINTCGVMTVTGDWGNWVFCREFHPSTGKDSGASGSYWDEKLRTSSEQESHKYDAEETFKLIKYFRKSFKYIFGRIMNDEELEWVNKLEYCSDNEYEYTYVAFREKPSSIDYEYVPFGKKRHFWLDAVYDGFDAICNLLKTQEENKNS